MKPTHLILAAMAAFAGWQPPAQAQAIVDLGSAANFAVLAGSAITFTGAVNSTTINGDIGAFPTAAITGLENVVLNGVNHAGDAVTQTAKDDLLTAYDAAAGRAATTVYGPIYDLGGLTLTAGVYRDPSSFGLTGSLTLDAQGDAAAVWIFQAGSTLTTVDSSRVLLLNGALAGNVFWQVGSSATLGASSSFVGTILAHDSIGVGTGTTVDGRVLALTAAVTMAGSDFAGASVVPEPAGTSLLIAGFLGLVIGFRRFRRQRSDRGHRQMGGKLS